MRHGYALISIAAISALLIAADAPPAPSLEGDWEGRGTVSNKVGVDHAECRVRYTRAGDRNFSYAATCTTGSGKYDLAGSVTSTSGSRYSGTVAGDGQQGSEAGHVILIQRGKHLSVFATSQRGSARMTLAKLG
jgi:hypothetical protein